MKKVISIKENGTIVKSGTMSRTRAKEMYAWLRENRPLEIHILREV